jgi:peroxiredoxin
MPAIQRVYQTYQDRGFLVLAVNATNQDSSNAAANFALEHNLTFPILLDLDGQVSNLYQLRALPSTFFVDHEGTIQEVVIGGPMADALLLTRVEQLFERLP